MDVTLATHRATHSLAPPGLYRRLAATCTAAGTLGLLLLGTLLLVRRAAGAFERPLNAVGLLALTLVLAAVCQGLHAMWRSLHLSRPLSLLSAATVSVAFLAVALALSLPGSPRAPLALLWAVLVAGEGVALLFVVAELQPVQRTLRVPSAELRAALPPSSPPLAEAALAPADLLPAGLLPAGVVQQMTRSFEPNTGEVIHGTLRETFIPGQRTASLHVAFCPPLAAVPELACEQIDGPESAIKVGELQPYGARFDLRLKRTSIEPVEVVLEWTALAPKAEA